MGREEIHCEEETRLMKTVLKGQAVQGFGCARVRMCKGQGVQGLGRAKVEVCKVQGQGLQGLQLGCARVRVCKGYGVQV